MQNENVNQSSSLVPGFERVSIASGFACPHCGRAFGPHDLHHDGDDEIHLRCTNCQRDAITVTLATATDEEGE